jgi:hypothetical protein
MRLALRRLTNCRNIKGVDGEDEQPRHGPLRDPKRYPTLEEEILCTSQIEFMQSEDVRLVVEQMRLKYCQYIQLKDQQTELEEHHDDPHSKRLLRKQAYKQLAETGVISLVHWTSKVAIKQKGDEYAKTSKYPRAIADLSIPASLQGFRITEFLKEAQSSEDIHFFGGVARFVKKPDPTVLCEVFQNLINPPGRFYYVYFSDDAAYSVRINGRVHMYNSDISSCDSSHTPALFQILIDIMPEDAKDQMRILVDQCRMPITIKSLTTKTEKVRLRPRQPILYSGSTITTAINNLASLMVAVAITSQPELHPVIAARQAGYNITLQECRKEEDIQFLKHSPVLDNKGTLRSCLNLGVLLRYSGYCKRDLPGRGPIEHRARHFQHLLLRGYMTHAHIPIVQLMKDRFPSIKILSTRTRELIAMEVAKIYQEKCQDLTSSHTQYHFRLANDDFLKRYDLNSIQEEELHQFFMSDYGDTAASSALDKILQKDYDFTTLSM